MDNLGEAQPLDAIEVEFKAEIKKMVMHAHTQGGVDAMNVFKLGLSNLAAATKVTAVEVSDVFEMIDTMKEVITHETH